MSPTPIHMTFYVNSLVFEMIRASPRYVTTARSLPLAASELRCYADVKPVPSSFETPDSRSTFYFSPFIAFEFVSPPLLLALELDASLFLFSALLFIFNFVV